MSTGPSLGTAFGPPAGVLVEGGGGPNKDDTVSSDPAFGNKPDSDGFLDRSIIPKCIRRDGKTLSEKTGKLLVEGMGKGGGESDPKRIVIP